MNLNEELKAYVDGQLSASERLEVEKAAASSEEIRAEIAALQALKEEFAPLTATPEPVGKSATMSKIRSNQVAKRTGSLMTRLVTVGVAGLFIVATGATLFPVFAQSRAASKASMARWQALHPSGGAAWSEESAKTESETPADNAADTASPSPASQAPSASAAHRSEGMNQRDEAKSARTATKSSIPVIPRQYGRDIIYNGALSVAVPDVQKAVVEASSLIQGLGGFIVSSQTNFEGGAGSAQLEIRVPASKFDTANKSLAKYGRVISQNSSGQDVTADIARGEGRSRALAVAEQEYIRMLSNARNTSARLEIRRRLDDVRAEREGIKAETNRLKDLSALSSLSLSFSEEATVKPDEPAENWWNDSNTGAANVLGFIGRIFGRVAIYLVYLSPVWLIGLVGWMIWRKKQG